MTYKVVEVTKMNIKKWWNTAENIVNPQGPAWLIRPQWYSLRGLQDVASSSLAGLKGCSRVAKRKNSEKSL